MFVNQKNYDKVVRIKIFMVIFMFRILRSLDQLIYFGSNISSTENDVNIHIGKAGYRPYRNLISLIK